MTGDFTGTFDEPGVTSEPTSADGTTVLTMSGSAKGSVSVTFCVTAVTHPNLDDWTGSVCASS